MKPSEDGKAKHPGGRPTIYTSEVVDKVLEYLRTRVDTTEVLGDNKPILVTKVNLPSIEGLALYLDLHKDTLYEWEKEHKEFSDVMTRVRNAQAERLVNNGLGGTYNPQIAKVLLTKHGYVDKQEVDQNISGELKTGNINPELADKFNEFIKNNTKSDIK